MIWVIGATGMLGREVCRILSENKIDFISTGHEVDITDYSVLESFVQQEETKAYIGSHQKGGRNKLSWIINCSAYTAVEKAETEKEAAFAINSTGAENIARIARAFSAKLIHVSTDYVFDGTAHEPYTEDTEKKPLGIYGKSKADGENAIARHMTQYYILRTAWLYGYERPNFVFTMIRLMNSKPELKVVNDQKGTPTFTGDLANVIYKIIYENEKANDDMPAIAKIPYGIYHYTGNGETTWFDFAREIYRLGKKYKRIQNECIISGCTTEEYGAKVKRPSYSVLAKNKIIEELKIKIPDWKVSLEKFIRSKEFQLPSN